VTIFAAMGLRAVGYVGLHIDPLPALEEIDEQIGMVVQVVATGKDQILFAPTNLLLPEKAIISHRGEKYEIGRGKRFYGIWVVGAPYEAPVDRWPETRDGWEQAWTRFATVEVPGQFKVALFQKKEHPTPEQIAANKLKWGMDPNA